MKTFLLKPGLVVKQDDRQWKFGKTMINKRLLFSDEMGETLSLSETEFYSRYERKEFYVDADQPYLGHIPKVTNAPFDLASYPQKYIDEALMKKKYLDMVMSESGNLPPNNELSKSIQRVADETGDSENTPSCASIRRWYAMYRHTRCVLSLIPKHFNKGRKASIQGELEDIAIDALGETFLTEQRLSISRAYQDFRDRVRIFFKSVYKEAIRAIPSRATFYRFVRLLDPYQVRVAREGKYKAQKDFLAALEEFHCSRILERWEIDHTLMDIILVDRDTGRSIGRPYLTIVIDRYSRMIMAYLVHLSAPCTESVLQVIERAIRPKHALLASHTSVTNKWPARGLPQYIVPDNAAEFHAKGLLTAFDELGIELVFPPSRAPHYKAVVERFFKTLNTGFTHSPRHHLLKSKNARRLRL